MAKKHVPRTDKLFEETEAVTAAFGLPDRGAAPQQVPLDRLVPSRFNPRHTYSREALEGLACSMREYGFIGALDGRELPDGRVELAYGTRRLLAARAANLGSIPVFLHALDDGQMRLVSLVENLAREDLTAAEQAALVGQIRDAMGLTPSEISRRLGKPQEWVEEQLALRTAPAEPAPPAQPVAKDGLDAVIDSIIAEQQPPSRAPDLARPALSQPPGSRPLARDHQAVRSPERSWLALGSPLVVLALEALDSFDPQAVPQGEIREAVGWLQRLRQRVDRVVESLEERR